VAMALSPTRERLARGWTRVLTWGGLRGALSMVLALALPEGFPHREQLIAMTFGVVLLSLVLQGTSMAWLLRRLGLTRERAGELSHEHARMTLRAVDVELAELNRLRREHAAPPEALDAMRQRIESRRAEALSQLAEPGSDATELRRADAIRAVRRLLEAERADLAEAVAEGDANPALLARQMADVDARLVRLAAGEFTDPADLLAPAQPDR